MKGKIQNTLNYMVRGIRFACSHFKNRSAGSPSERKCQNHFKNELKQWADQVEDESFTFHPKAFMGWLPIASLLSMISIVMFWLRLNTESIITPIIAITTILLSVLLFLFEFVFYREFVDFLFPKAISRNILARRAPKGEVKRRIIFGGHADAAYEMTYSLKGGKRIAKLVLVGACAGIFVILLCNLALLVHSLVSKSVSQFLRLTGFVELAFIPFLIAILFFINWRLIVDGANDNLSGCYVAMGVLREMAQKKMRLENTEVCCLITGAEESGIRGSLSFAKRHSKEFLKTETVFIALDTLREINHLKTYTIGQNGTQKNSEAVGELLGEAGKKCGIRLEKAKIYPGATDAEGFSRNGILSCGLCGVNHDPQLYYHTRFDNSDNISEECLELSLQVCFEAMQLYDKNNGIQPYIERNRA